MQNSELTRDLAALDLGSNSFHLIIVRYEQGQIRIVDRLNEYVRLAAGLDENNHIYEEKILEALDALARIGQRLREIEHRYIRIVGTNTLRKAKNAYSFVRRAESVLNHPIEIISGKEEARLIYAGVSSIRASGDGKHLVIDIGGGSTEFIIGEANEPICMESLFMGCVSTSERFFAKGKITRSAMKQAIDAASVELMPIVENYKRVGWKTVVGSSGSVKAVLKTVQAAGWCKNLITSKGLAKLTRKLIELGEITPRNLPGLSEKRMPVFAGGVAVLNACFRDLGIDRMEVSDAALREGVIQDLIGRRSRQDVRNGSVSALAQRYHVDLDQADRVKTTALQLFDAVADEWGLDPEIHKPLLSWAADLHEIGLDISHHQYHKHGAYVIANTDLPGFSITDRAILSTLVRGHRRKLNELVFNPIPDTILKSVERLVMLLRLSVLIHRDRNPVTPPEVVVSVQKKKIRLRIDEAWQQEHPLTLTQIEEENSLIGARGFSVTVLSDNL